MKKKYVLKKLGILGAIAGIVSGCGFNPQQNIEADVYGPPIEDINDIDELEDLNDPEDFDPSMNEIMCIYGPPEMMEQEPVYTPDENMSDGMSESPLGDQ